MKPVDPTWKAAVFVCTHERAADSGRASCGFERGSQLRDHLKKRMKACGKKGVVLTAKSGCLGVCSPRGVTVAVVPEPGSGLVRRSWICEDEAEWDRLFEAVHEAATGEGVPEDSDTP